MIIKMNTNIFKKKLNSPTPPSSFNPFFDQLIEFSPIQKYDHAFNFLNNIIHKFYKNGCNTYIIM